MTRKPPRVGVLLLLVAFGAGSVGFVAGRFGPGAPSAPPSRSGSAPRRAAADPPPGPAYESLPPGVLPGDEAEDADVSGSVAAEAGSEAPAGPPPKELVATLKEHAHGERAQAILAGMIADAARTGGAMLPELRELLASGEDIRFTGYDAAKGGFPTLRVALMAAAEATGDPAAAALIAEVTQTTESPVEVVFGAHLLDRLDALDAPTAQRTLDSLARTLTEDQRKAIGPLAGKVVPAAAAVDPGYAETLLVSQLRDPKGAATRMLLPALEGLPADRARDLVSSALTAGDVADRTKALLAGQATRRPEVEMLRDVRQAIESRVLAPRVASRIASRSMSGPEYGSLLRRANTAVRSGDLAAARALAQDFFTRVNEAQRMVEAARAAGGRVPPTVDTTAKRHLQFLDELRRRIARETKRAEKAE